MGTPRIVIILLDFRFGPFLSRRLLVNNLPRFVSLAAALVITATQLTLLSGWPSNTHRVSVEGLPVIVVTAHRPLSAAVVPGRVPAPPGGGVTGAVLATSVLRQQTIDGSRSCFGNFLTTAQASTMRSPG
jgi:hypothetical protein